MSAEPAGSAETTRRVCAKEVWAEIKRRLPWLVPEVGNAGDYAVRAIRDADENAEAVIAIALMPNDSTLPGIVGYLEALGQRAVVRLATAEKEIERLERLVRAVEQHIEHCPSPIRRGQLRVALQANADALLPVVGPEKTD